MADIFLSYAREDEVRAGELAAALEAQGWSVFWDRRIPAGESWRSYIGTALQTAACIVVAWSRHSVDSQWVLEEADEGRLRGVLIPVMLDSVMPPRGFKEIQVADLSAWQPGQPSERFDQLVADLRRMLARRSEARPADAPGATPVPPTVPPSPPPPPQIQVQPSPPKIEQPAVQSKARWIAPAIGGALAVLAVVGYLSGQGDDTKPPEVAQLPERVSPKAPPSAVAPSRESAAQGWLVIVSSVRKSERRDADSLRNRLVAAGIDATLIDSNDYPLLTPNLLVVGLGPFATRDAANAALAQVKPQHSDAYVKKGR